MQSCRKCNQNSSSPSTKNVIFPNCNLQIGHAEDLPPAVVDDYENNEEFLKKAHHALMEVNL